MHAELPDFVARSRDHAARTRAADDERLATQAWVIKCLDGRVERVHVDVKNRARSHTAVSVHVALERVPMRTSSVRCGQRDRLATLVANVDTSCSAHTLCSHLRCVTLGGHLFGC